MHQTRDHHNPDEFDPTDEAFGFDDSPAIPVEVKTGDVVFFNGYLLHRSMKNRSTHTRRALVNHGDMSTRLAQRSFDPLLGDSATPERIPKSHKLT